MSYVSGRTTNCYIIYKIGEATVQKIYEKIQMKNAITFKVFVQYEIYYLFIYFFSVGARWKKFIKFNIKYNIHCMFFPSYCSSLKLFVDIYSLEYCFYKLIHYKLQFLIIKNLGEWITNNIVKLYKWIKIIKVFG